MSDEKQGSSGEFLRETKHVLTELFHTEVALFKAECSAGLSRVVFAGIAIFCAVFAFLIALNVLAGTAVIALTQAGLDPVWAGLSVGLGALIFAVSLVLLGVFLIKRAVRRIAQPFRNIGKDAKAIRGAYRDK